MDVINSAAIFSALDTFTLAVELREPGGAKVVYDQMIAKAYVVQEVKGEHVVVVKDLAVVADKKEMAYKATIPEGTYLEPGTYIMVFDLTLEHEATKWHSQKGIRFATVEVGI